MEADAAMQLASHAIKRALANGLPLFSEARRVLQGLYHYACRGNSMTQAQRLMVEALLSSTQPAGITFGFTGTAPFAPQRLSEQMTADDVEFQAATARTVRIAGVPDPALLPSNLAGPFVPQKVYKKPVTMEFTKEPAAKKAAAKGTFAKMAVSSKATKPQKTGRFASVLQGARLASDLNYVRVQRQTTPSTQISYSARSAPSGLSGDQGRTVFLRDVLTR